MIYKLFFGQFLIFLEFMNMLCCTYVLLGYLTLVLKKDIYEYICSMFINNTIFRSAVEFAVDRILVSLCVCHTYDVLLFYSDTNEHEPARAAG